MLIEEDLMIKPPVIVGLSNSRSSRPQSKYSKRSNANMARNSSHKGLKKKTLGQKTLRLQEFNFNRDGQDESKIDMWTTQSGFGFQATTSAGIVSMKAPRSGGIKGSYLLDMLNNDLNV